METKAITIALISAMTEVALLVLILQTQTVRVLHEAMMPLQRVRIDITQAGFYLHEPDS